MGLVHAVHPLLYLNNRLINHTSPNNLPVLKHMCHKNRSLEGPFHELEQVAMRFKPGVESLKFRHKVGFGSLAASSSWSNKPSNEAKTTKTQYLVICFV